MACLNLVTARELALHNRKARGGIDLFGLLLVHRKGRGQHARMGVRNAQPFENALHTAIFAPAAMQGIEGNVGLHFGQTQGEIGAAIDLDHLISGLPQGFGALTPR